MSKRGYGRTDLSESFQEFLSSLSSVVFYVGLLATVSSVGLLIFTYMRLSGPDAAAQSANALKNIELFQKILLAGSAATAVGALLRFWGEELLGAVLAGSGAAMYFAPLFLPSVLGESKTDASAAALTTIQSGGILLGIIGMGALTIDVVTRVTGRVKKGAKSDQIKYGKGMKEEATRQNVFLGKCWQLPFCRKFVREQCPIYHAKTTCWKELVGCMCEESVITTAMSGKTFSKESLMNGTAIPRNNKLTVPQKKERCRSCVIYNEHLRHQYKISLPAAVISILALYAIFHGQLAGIIINLCKAINAAVRGATLGATGNFVPPTYFVEALLFMFVILVISYVVKMIEFAIFKLKI